MRIDSDGTFALQYALRSNVTAFRVLEDDVLADSSETGALCTCITGGGGGGGGNGHVTVQSSQCDGFWNPPESSGHVFDELVDWQTATSAVHPCFFSSTTTHEI